MRRDVMRFDGETIYAVDTRVFKRPSFLGDPKLVRWLPNRQQNDTASIAGHLVDENGSATAPLALTPGRVIGTWKDHLAEQEELRKRCEQMRANTGGARLNGWRALVIARVGKSHQAIPYWLRQSEVPPSGRITVQELALLVESAYTNGVAEGSKARPA